jgi:regulator of sigma E protease
MTEFFGSIWWLLVSLGLLVTFHEFGHYWVARRCGVRVLRFSVGFGRPLWTRIGKDGTEYVIAALPLGGYVRMLDEREVEVAPHERPHSFNAKSVWQRIAIVAAGPFANLLMCVGLLWLMFVIGRPDLPPQFSVAPGLAADAGMRSGDLVLSIGERTTPTITDAAVALANVGMDRVATPARVRGLDGSERRIVLPLDRLAPETRPQDITGALGLDRYISARIDSVDPELGAWGRLQPGDRVVAIEGEPVVDGYDLQVRLKEFAAPGRTLDLRVERDGRTVDVQVDPRLTGSGAAATWRLGIVLEATAQAALLRYGPLDAVPAALRATAQTTGDILGLLKRIVLGRASLENVSGPISIARSANSTAGLGVAWFLYFLAMLSLSLCIMNLLPIPVLDGGHLLYYLIELVKGSPVGERVLVAGQYVGLVFLAGLMGLAFYNDLFRPGF